MDLQELTRAAERARRFSHELGGRTFDLVLPTQFAVDCIGQEARLVYARVMRGTVLAALRGWNVRTTDLRLPPEEVADEPLAYSREAAELLFGERPDWEQALMDEIARRHAERSAQLEAAKGN